MNRQVLNPLLILALLTVLLTACSQTKPLERCNDEFTPINVDAVVKP